MRRRSLGAAVGCAIAAASCSVDFNVPSTAVITCSTDADCPGTSGSRACVNGYCVASAGGPDLTGAPSVSPAIGTAGTTFTIGLATNHHVDKATLILQMTPSAAVPCSSSDPTHYSCQYTSTGNENGGIGGQVPFNVDLKDPGASGAEFVQYGAGQFTLDFTPPAVLGALLERTDNLAIAYSDGGLLLSKQDPYRVLTNGGTPQAVIAFAVSKPLRDGGVSVMVGDGGTTLVPNLAPGFGYTYLYTPSGKEPQLPTPVTASLTDVAGNSAIAQLGTIIFDFTAPVTDFTKVIYSRDVPESVYTLRADNGAFEAGGRVRLYLGPDGGSPVELTPSLTGALPVSAAPGDLQTVYLEQMDAAGNVSARSGVKRIEWVVSFAGKTSGSTTFNPHAAFYGDGSSPTPDFTSPELGDSDYAAISGVGPPWTTGSTPRVWTAATVPERFGYAGVFDSVRSRLVVFGGNDGAGTVFNDTWEWDGAAWINRGAGGGPSARYLACAAYDSNRGRTVLFGGSDGTTVLGETWEWDGTIWSRETPVSAPRNRSEAGCAFDASRGRTVLFGGWDGTNRLGDTWEWDGTAWTNPSASQAPTPRAEFGMAFDRARGRTVLFGGLDPSRTALNDTWEWDGITWTLRSTGTAPAARYLAAMDYDPNNGGVLMFGGVDALGSPLSDLWKWNGTAWTNLTPSPLPSSWPSASLETALVFSTNQKVTLLFGGRTASSLAPTPLNDTWAWDGTKWTRQAPFYPPARSGHGMAFDSPRGRSVVFGGCVGYYPTGDTWEWDGTNWKSFAPGTSPSNRSAPAITFDSARGVTLLFGGDSGNAYTPGPSLSDTWEWNGTTWTKQTPASSPPIRAGAAMAFDAKRGVAVLFGGVTNPPNCAGGGPLNSLSDLWEWNGTAWANRTPSPLPANWPAARAYHSMTFDSTGQRVVLFGGRQDYLAATKWLSDTWEWDGNAWTNLSTSGPAARSDAALVFDSAQGRMVLFGGWDGSTTFEDTWEWDGTAWTPVSGSGPGPRAGHAMTFDTARGRTVLFGGTLNSSGAADDVWERGAPLFRSLVVQASTLTATTALPGPGLTYSVTSLGVTGNAGGTATLGSGVVVEAWNGAQSTWLSLCGAPGVPCNTAPASGVAALAGVITNAVSDLDSLVSVDSVGIRLRPLGPTPIGTLALAANDLRFQIVYQRP